MNDPGPPPPSGPAAPPAWYPDPTGAHEFRYFNGASWTADVSDDGARFVDPIGAAPQGGAPSAPGGNPMAVAALTCGIIAVAIGWLPVLFAIGAVLAVLAIAFGATGIRRSRHTGRGRGMALAGLLTGVAGVLVAIGGLVFTVAMFRALDRYENPEPHTALVTGCEVVSGVAEVTGTLRNDGDRVADFTILVDVERAGSGVRIATTRQHVNGVEPGDTAEWSVSRPVTVDAIECSDPDVSGPLPFGVMPR